MVRKVRQPMISVLGHGNWRILSAASPPNLFKRTRFRSSNKFDRYNPKVHAVTNKGADLLGFYQKLEREVM